MPIQVLCPGCKKRFDVNDRFAGKKGPCPKCKTIITIPEKIEEVVVHAPEQFGPKDSSGQAVLKPIARKETKVSLLLTVGIVLGIIVAIVVALILRSQGGDISLAILGAASLVLAPPIVWGGYAVLRNSEMEPFGGSELWIRVGICSVAYVAIWGVVAFVNWYLPIDYSQKYDIAIIMPMMVGVMVGVGAFAAYASLDMDFSIGALHYGFYLLVTILLRLIAFGAWEAVIGSPG